MSSPPIGRLTNAGIVSAILSIPSIHRLKLVVKNDDLKDDNLKAKAKDVIANLKETVIADSNWRKLYKKAHGLQIEMPFLGKPIEGYEELQFAKDTNWDEALNSMNS